MLIKKKLQTTLKCTIGTRSIVKKSDSIGKRIRMNEKREKKERQRRPKKERQGDRERKGGIND